MQSGTTKNLRHRDSLVLSIPRGPRFHEQSPISDGARLSQLQALVDYHIAPRGEMDSQRSKLGITDADIELLQAKLTFSISGGL